KLLLGGPHQTNHNPATTQEISIFSQTVYTLMGPGIIPGFGGLTEPEVSPSDLMHLIKSLDAREFFKDSAAIKDQ
ncbi:MAG: hypothetical protein Q8Q56_05595, partial [Alphaproteobacteria bacterium]|nr:hypothetical protein [Alphaproteobacteria bacterium]